MQPDTIAGASQQGTARMNALVCDRYGAPEVLALATVAAPSPGPGELLVRVHAAAVTTADCTARSGSPYFSRVAFGLTRPKQPILGTEFSGRVIACGPSVTRFRPGDSVFAATGARFGAHAELVCLSETGAIAHQPAGCSDEEAAALAEGGLTALPFLRDEAKLQRGQVILIHGAAGCVGSAAVQLAKSMGAHVIGVCRGQNRARVLSLGADEVIDYERDDFTQRVGAYDVVFDAVGKSSFSRCRRALRAEGVYLSTVPSLSILAAMLRTRLFGRQRARLAFTGLRPGPEKAKDLDALRALYESGTIRPVIDSVYSWREAAEAHRRVESGHKTGSVILRPAPEG